MTSHSATRGPPTLTLFYVSAALGAVGHAMFVYGVVVALTDRFARPMEASIAYAIAFLTMAVLTPVRGYLGDVTPLSRLIRRCVLSMAGAVSVFALILQAMPAQSLYVFAAFCLCAVYGYASGGVAGNRMAMAPRIVEAHATPTVVLSMMSVFGFTFGPLFYAAARAVLGDPAAMLATSIMLAASAIILPIVKSEDALAASRELKIWRGVRDGVLRIFSQQKLWSALLLGATPSLFVLGPLQTVAPLFIAEQKPSAEIFRGIVFVALGVGILAGGVLSAKRFARSRKRRRFASISSLFACAGLALFTQFANAPSLIGLAFLCGVGLGVPHALVPVLLQNHVEDRLRARVMAVLTLKVTAVPAIGAVVCGFMASKLGAGPALFAMATTGFAAGLAIMRFQK
ncbi:MAG: MFS transporter [Pseudomonadota bacterium]